MFFGLCSIPKIQRPLKAQSKNRKIDEETSVSRRFYLFCQVLRPCSIEYTKMELLYDGAVFLFYQDFSPSSEQLSRFRGQFCCIYLRISYDDKSIEQAKDLQV